MSNDALHLTQVRLDPRNRSVRSDLRSVTALHRTVMSLFPDTDAPEARAALEVLYRLDNTHTGPVLLVQSALEADLTALPEGYGTAAATTLAPLFERLTVGTRVRYRTLVNATKRVAKGERAGKRIALGAADTREWWTQRASAAGLELVDDPVFVATTITGTDPADGRITLRPWQIDGTATVTETQPLTQAIRSGIGRGKAFGCGLVSLALR